MLTCDTIIIVLFAMFFCHIVDDYYLQGILAKLKQKLWWKQNYPDKKYKNDWIVALVEHAFSWSFTIMLPILAHMFFIGKINGLFYVCAILINVVIHALIDNGKANDLSINLWQDQCLHGIQVIFTWGFYCMTL